MYFSRFGGDSNLDVDECIMVFKVFEKTDVPPLVPTLGNQKSSIIRTTPTLLSVFSLLRFRARGGELLSSF